MQITLYSTGCPQCNVLKRKLEAANIEYTLNTDQEEMMNLGFRSAPVLKVDDVYYIFTDALAWLKERNQANGN